MAAFALNDSAGFRFRHANRISGLAPGLVTKDGAPANERVRLYGRATGVLLADKLSRGDGTYQFDGLDETLLYSVVAIDRAGEHNAVIADLIAPAPYPEP